MPRSNHARYDGFGNLYQKNVTQGSAPSLSVSVNAATNQLTETGLGYDANGNALGVYPASQTYDVENRVSSAGQYNSPQVLYAYDPGNRRVWKGTVNSSGVITAQEMYFYGATGKKLGTYVAAFGPLNTSYWTATDLQVHFGSRRVAHWASTQSTQVTLGPTILDRVGSVRNAGTSSASSFYPYGEDKGTAAPNDQTKFATYTRDSATGLDYATNRYYSSTLGRFASPDPYTASGGPSDPQSWNRYSYTRSDPVNRLDPDGTTDCDADFCVTGYGYDDPSGGGGGGDPGPQQQTPTDPKPPIVDSKTNTAAHQLLKKRLANLGTCLKILQQGGVNVDKVINNQTSIRFYDASSSSVYSQVTLGYIDPQAKGNASYNTELGDIVSTNATTIMGTNVVLLGGEYFGANLNQLSSSQLAAFQLDQADTLVHEAIHDLTGFTDAQFFSDPVFLKNGLDPSLYNKFGQTGAITQWLDNGCKKAGR